MLNKKVVRQVTLIMEKMTGMYFITFVCVTIGLFIDVDYTWLGDNASHALAESVMCWRQDYSQVSDEGFTVRLLKIALISAVLYAKYFREIIILCLIPYILQSCGGN